MDSSNSPENPGRSAQPPATVPVQNYSSPYPTSQTIVVQAPVAAPKPSNGLGIAGFICSLVGLFLCGGIICPVGLILSAMGLRKEPKGLAIAGLIIGLIGTLLLVTILFIWGVFGIACLSAGGH